MSYKFNLPPTPEQLEAIGMVAVECSYLESHMGYAIGFLAGVTDVDVLAAMTTHLTIRQRLEMVSTLFHLSQQYPPEKVTEFESIRKQIDKAISRRNSVVHSRWITGERGSPLVFEVQARGTLKRNRIDLPVEEIKAIAADIAEQTERLVRVLSGTPPP